jgi:hypothetical protein
MTTWDVSVVLTFLFTLYPLSELSLKLLTYKLIALIALTTAARAQTISALDINYMSKFMIHLLLMVLRWMHHEMNVQKTLKYLFQTKIKLALAI